MILSDISQSYTGQRWGGKLPNGTYDGVLGMVKNGKADLGIGNFFFVLHRSLVIQYCYPYDLEVSGQNLISFYLKNSLT